MAKLADSTGDLRPTAARVLTALRAGGPHTLDQLTATLADRGRAIRPTTVQIALGELVAAGLVAEVGEDTEHRWLALPAACDPLLEVVDLHGAHDFRHTFATWLEDAGIPARVIDEVTATRPPAAPASSGAAPWAPTTGTPPRRWPPASPP
jgi:hypothetical protein